MAVTATGAIYKTLTFDGASSGTYGVYITGEAVYNAPEKDVEMVEIPGRNGAYALDRGRWQNIEVSYPAGIYADNETDFAEAISDFRNWLCSRQGYCKLTDDYNDGEYRLAIYKSGLEVTPAQLTAGEFEIVFDCKPQRFLTAGEDKITVHSGDDITNPTLYDAKPLLEVTGYGVINMDSDVIDFDGQDIGDIIIASSGYGHTAWANTTATRTVTISIDDTFLASGDPINLTIKNQNVIKTTVGGSTSIAYYNTCTLAASFIYGTSASQNNSDTSGTMTASITAAYNGSATITLTISSSFPGAANKTIAGYYEYTDTTAYSSVPSDNSKVYIDLDIGEAYTIDNGVAVSLNNRVTLPAELPVLAPGNTNITYDNTITKLEITPRYWKL